MHNFIMFLNFYNPHNPQIFTSTSQTCSYFAVPFALTNDQAAPMHLLLLPTHHQRAYR